MQHGSNAARSFSILTCFPAAQPSPLNPLPFPYLSSQTYRSASRATPHHRMSVTPWVSRALGLETCVGAESVV